LALHQTQLARRQGYLVLFAAFVPRWEAHTLRAAMIH
jgi:hypothetical protein